MRHLKGHILLAVCTLLVGICAAQQPSTVATAATVSVPNLIRYSGTLKDAQGAAFLPRPPAQPLLFTTSRTAARPSG